MNVKINISCLCSIAGHIFVECSQVILLKVNVGTKDRSVSCCGKKERVKKVLKTIQGKEC